MKWSQDSLDSMRRGFLDALPITASYALFATIFGMLARQTGLSTWESVAMSLIVYTGAGQFSALSMLAEQAGVSAILLTTLLLSSRHLLMGLSLSPHYQRFSSAEVHALAFFLTDEQYAITLNRFRHHQSDFWYILGVSLPLYISWCGGTWLGAVAGQWIPDPASMGLGFSFTAMFLALAYYQLTTLVRVLTFLLCGAVAVGLALVLPSGLDLLAAGLLAFAIGYAMPTTEPRETSEPLAAKEVETA
jgi:4-azaleucine resistance transporter AzlC